MVRGDFDGQFRGPARQSSKSPSRRLVAGKIWQDQGPIRATGVTPRAGVTGSPVAMQEFGSRYSDIGSQIMDNPLGRLWCGLCTIHAVGRHIEYHHSVTTALLREKVKERRSSIVCRYKKGKTIDLYTEKRPYSAKPSITSGAQRQLPVPGLDLLLGMGTSEANGGRKPQASCPSPPAPKTNEGTGPNS